MGMTGLFLRDPQGDAEWWLVAHLVNLLLLIDLHEDIHPAFGRRGAGWWPVPRVC